VASLQTETLPLLTYWVGEGLHYANQGTRSFIFEEECPLMTNRYRKCPGSRTTRGSTARQFQTRPREAGRAKRGTPNVISADYKKAILEAAYRIGNDGNGKGRSRWLFILGRLTSPADLL
jgi:hypothetical protein